MKREIPNTREITAFMHCAACFKERLPPNIEAGWTALGFQVWCRNHDINVVHVDFEGQRHPANTTRAPEEIPETKH